MRSGTLTDLKFGFGTFGDVTLGPDIAIQTFSIVFGNFVEK